eukprot:7378170-Prymnesium_polylepis.1
MCDARSTQPLPRAARLLARTACRGNPSAGAGAHTRRALSLRFIPARRFETLAIHASLAARFAACTARRRA